MRQVISQLIVCFGLLLCIRWRYFFSQDAGWSSLVARQAHNLKAAGSNPAPATNFMSENWSAKHTK